MRAMRIKLKDETGRVYHWRVWRVEGVINVIPGKKSRKVSGWTFEDHDGYERFAEGNWSELVAKFRLTAENYGLTTNIS